MITRKQFCFQPEENLTTKNAKARKGGWKFLTPELRSWYYRLSKVFAACANPTIWILEAKISRIKVVKRQSSKSGLLTFILQFQFQSGPLFQRCPCIRK